VILSEFLNDTGSAVAVESDEWLQNDLATIKSRVSANTRAVFLVNPSAQSFRNGH
jgi:hypothetical protein